MEFVIFSGKNFLRIDQMYETDWKLFFKLISIVTSFS